MFKMPTVDPERLFLDALAWLEANYARFRFFAERDVVWTVQTRLLEVINQQDLPFVVRHDVPLLPGSRRGLSADLVISSEDEGMVVAVEFKYEPSHHRDDIPKSKLPVVFWGAEGLAKDIVRIHKFIEAERATVAYAIFIDEGSAFRHRPAHLGAHGSTGARRMPRSGSSHQSISQRSSGVR